MGPKNHVDRLLVALERLMRPSTRRAPPDGHPGTRPARAGPPDVLLLPDGRLPKIGQLDDPVQLGVHRSIPAPAGAPAPEGPPAYVPRDREATHRAQLSHPGFTVLVGHSTAGKSRLAYESLRATVPDHTLIAPHGRATVGTAVEQAMHHRDAVLWLDGLEHYVGTGGLCRDHIVRLLDGPGHHRLIVATIRSAAHAELTSSDVREARVALEQAHEIRLERRFSRNELRRAEAIRRRDPRIREALASADHHGIAEYLAAGPELRRDHQNAWRPGANPRGAALVSAALDCNRAGLRRPSRALLEEIHGEYLREHGGDQLDPEPLEVAWEWATRRRRDTAALLTPTLTTAPAHDTTAETDTVEVFDYLVDGRQRELGRGCYVPEHIVAPLLRAADQDVALTIGQIAFWHSNTGTAERAFERARALYEAAGDERGQAHAHRGLGTAATTRGNQVRALHAYERALHMFRQARDQPSEADVLVDLGDLHTTSGELDRAMDSYEQARDLHQAAGNRPGEADVLAGMAHVAKQLHEYVPASRMYQQSLRLQQELGDQLAQARTLRQLADVAEAQQADEQASRLLQEALRLCQQRRDHTGTVHTLVKIGGFALGRHELRQAARSFEAARSLSEDTHFSMGRMQALGGLAAVAEAEGDFARATQLSERLLTLARTDGHLSVQVVALSALGDIARAQGDFDAAIRRYQQAREVCQDGGARHSEAVVLCSLALTAEEEGRRDDARADLLRARAIFEDFGDERWIGLCSEALDGLTD